MAAIFAEFYGGIDCLEQRLGVNAGNDKISLIDGLRTLGAGTDADCRERMTHTCEETAFFWESAAIAYHCKSIHLQTIVVMESERFMLNHAGIKLESAGGKTIAATGMTAVEYRHIIFLSHCIDGIEETEKVLLRIYILFSVCAQENVPTLFKTETPVHVTGFNLSKILVKNFRHWRTGDIGAFIRKTAVGEVAAGMLAICHVNIGDYIHDTAVCLFGKAFVFTAVACFHVEDRDMETLGTNDTEATVGVAEYENAVRFGLYHEFVAPGDDIAHGFTEVSPNRVHIHFRVSKFEILEEYSVEIVVIVLTSVGKYHIEVLAAFVDYRCETDNLRTGAHDDEKFQFAVIFELCHILLFHFAQI